MFKVIKAILGLLVISGLGLVYGKFDDAAQELKEERRYAYISFSFPETNIRTTLIKKTPESQCEKWRNDYFEASMAQCQDCNVIVNECRTEITELEQKAFEQQDINRSYIYKPYNFPEVSMYSRLQDGMFDQVCEMAKNSLESTVCFE